MKHIIFTGKENTGKTLFAKMIFGGENTAVLEGRIFDIENDYFLFDLNEGDFAYDTLIIDDLKSDFNFESLYTRIFQSTMCTNRMNRSPEIIKTPLFIFITNYPENLPVLNSFKNSFDVIDFDKDPVSNLMDLIREKKITVKTW